MTTSPASSTTLPRLRSPRGGLTVGDRQYRPGVFLPASAAPVLEALARKAATAATEGPVVIGIAGHSYRIEPIAIAPSIGTVGYSLVDLDRNRLHHVHRTISGEVACDCGDFAFRRSGTGDLCKHGRRLIELGLIPATVPTTLPPFARRIDGGLSLADRGLRRNEAPKVDSTSRPRRPRFEPSADDLAEAAAAFGW